MMEQTDERYLRLQLDWVRQRLEALDKIEQQLTEMREIAIMAQDVGLGQPARDALNTRMQVLQRSVQVLDEQSRTFWLDKQ